MKQNNIESGTGRVKLLKLFTGRSAEAGLDLTLSLSLSLFVYIGLFRSVSHAAQHQ